MKITWLFATLLTLVAVPVYADDAKVCAAYTVDTDAEIRACTNWLKRGHLSAADQATAHYNRALAYEDDFDYDNAFADFERAIQLKPDNADFYYDRGLAYEDVKEFELAIADFSNAIRLKPDMNAAHFYRGLASWNLGDVDSAIADFGITIQLGQAVHEDFSLADAYADRGSVYSQKGALDLAIADDNQAVLLKPNKYTYRLRGRAFLFAGDLAKAEADFRSAAELDPGDAITALWLDIAERRGGGPGHLEAAIGKLDMTKWPAPIVRLYLGELTQKGLVAETSNDADGCLANDFSGELALINGDKASARQFFTLVTKACYPWFSEEVSAAAAELHFLGADAAK